MDFKETLKVINAKENLSSEQSKETKWQFYKIYQKSKKTPSQKIYVGTRILDDIEECYYLSTVSCFVLDENNNVLVEIRGKNESQAYTYDLCSGHIDGNETPTQAMIREYVEELHGRKVRRTKFSKRRSNRQNEKIIRNRFNI